VHISAGHKHTAFLDDQGRVFTTGNNENGQLGIASRSVQQMPMQIDNFEHDAKMVAAGLHHTLLLTKSG
jgi:alpha-tubulin suppressor-like RCC1 family protein